MTTTTHTTTTNAFANTVRRHITNARAAMQSVNVFARLREMERTQLWLVAEATQLRDAITTTHNALATLSERVDELETLDDQLDDVRCEIEGLEQSIEDVQSSCERLGDRIDGTEELVRDTVERVFEDENIEEEIECRIESAVTNWFSDADFSTEICEAVACHIDRGELVADVCEEIGTRLRSAVTA